MLKKTKQKSIKISCGGINENYYKQNVSDLKFISQKETINMIGYEINNSIIYLANKQTNFLFAINAQKIPNFNKVQSELLDYWSYYNGLTAEQQGYYINAYQKINHI